MDYLKLGNSMTATKKATKAKSPKRVKPKVNPLDKKPKKTAAKKAKPSKIAMAGGNGKQKKRG